MDDNDEGTDDKNLELYDCIYPSDLEDLRLDMEELQKDHASQLEEMESKVTHAEAQGALRQRPLAKRILTGIFHRIQKNPFSLKENDDARATMNAQNSEIYSFDSSFFDFRTNATDRKREKFRKENDEMMRASEQLLKQRPIFYFIIQLV